MMNAATSFSEFDTVDAETRQVMQSRVNSSVRHKYETQNVKFLVWLFDSRQHYDTLLKSGLVAELETQHQRDRERKTRADRPSKKRDHLRATCRDWLQRAEADRPETHPIELGDHMFPIFA